MLIISLLVGCLNNNALSQTWRLNVKLDSHRLSCFRGTWCRLNTRCLGQRMSVTSNTQSLYVVMKFFRDQVLHQSLQ